MDIAIILAAGPLLRRGTKWWRPRALLSLGLESVIERILGQLEKFSIPTIVVVGKAGEGGWHENHLKAFRRLSCTLITSSYLKRHALSSLRFTLQHVIQNKEKYGIEDHSKVYIIWGDHVFSDDLIEEIVNYSIPCGFMNKKGDGLGLVLTGKSLQPILDLMTPFQECCILLFILRKKEELEKLGLEMWKGYIGNTRGGRFAEIDQLPDYERAISLVAKLKDR